MLWAYNYGNQIFIPGFTKNKNIMTYVKCICNSNKRIFPFSVNPFPKDSKQIIYALAYFNYSSNTSEFQLRNQIGEFQEKNIVDFISAKFLNNGKFDICYHRPDQGRKKRKVYLNSSKINWNSIEFKLAFFCLNNL